MRHPHGLRAAAGLPTGPEIGEFYEGGYFAGYISQNANGVATHGLLVAPEANGSNGGTALQFKESNNGNTYGSSTFDGATNTASQANDGAHPAATYCAGLTINTYSDWYLPAQWELEIAYFNLKPTTENNDTGHGGNPYAVPSRATFNGAFYTNNPRNPDQTTVSIFQDGGSEDFPDTEHWSSTQHNSTTGKVIRFNDGTPSNISKTDEYRVRAFRKFAV